MIIKLINYYMVFKCIQVPNSGTLSTLTSLYGV